ncbi:Testis-expressed protein 30 [Mortierella claussenii]|nr:Testis-expressed protein 30 [Mortierella claussenii]
MSEPTQKEISISWPDKAAITVLLTSPPKAVEPSGYGLILGPGAGGEEKTPLLTAIANEVARQGHYCARYRAKVPNLVAGTIAAQVASHNSKETASDESTKTTAVKGKKAAPAKKKVAAAASTPPASSDYPDHFITGLILFSYPLHTADNTKALRDQILYDIPPATSTLFVSGLKDTMCQPSIFAKVFKDMKASHREVVQVQDADHGLGFGSSKPGQAKKEALIVAIAEWATAFMDDTIAGNAEAVASKKKAEMKKIADEWTVTVTTVV